jgi:hypothetical protein
VTIRSATTAGCTAALATTARPHPRTNRIPQSVANLANPANLENPENLLNPANLENPENPLNPANPNLANPANLREPRESASLRTA